MRLISFWLRPPELVDGVAASMRIDVPDFNGWRADRYDVSAR